MSTARSRFTAATLAFVPLAVLACGGGEDRTTTPATTTTVSAGATTPTLTPHPANGTDAPLVVSSSYTDGEASFRAGRYDEAATIFGAYTDTKPENVWGHYMLGLSAWKAGDLNRAERAFDRALEVDADHVKTLINSSRVLLSLGRPADAQARIERVMELAPQSPDATRLFARARYEQGDVAGAVTSYQSALALDERDTWSMNNLGLLYLEQGQAETALGPLARAVELRSTSPVFQNNLGIALERTGHYTAAIKAFEAALTADSTYTKASVSLERVKGRTPSTEVDSIDLQGLAQEFALQIRMWRDSAAPAADSVEATPADSGSAQH